MDINITFKQNILSGNIIFLSYKEKMYTYSHILLYEFKLSSLVIFTYVFTFGIHYSKIQNVKQLIYNTEYCLTHLTKNETMMMELRKGINITLILLTANRLEHLHLHLHGRITKL